MHILPNSKHSFQCKTTLKLYLASLKKTNGPRQFVRHAFHKQRQSKISKHTMFKGIPLTAKLLIEFKKLISTNIQRSQAKHPPQN